MRTLIGLVATITASILAYILWRPTLNWVFTRIPPETPADWKPRMRTWKNGIEQ